MTPVFDDYFLQALNSLIFRIEKHIQEKYKYVSSFDDDESIVNVWRRCKKFPGQSTVFQLIVFTM
jgi:hypothetical protein